MQRSFAVQSLLLRYVGDGWVFSNPQGELEAINHAGFATGFGSCQLPEVLAALTEKISNAKSGFLLKMSEHPFPEAEASLSWQKAEQEGHWYQWVGHEEMAWLGPGLKYFFETPPAQLYLQAIAL